MKSLYLARVHVQVREALRLRLTDSYSWHRAAWQVFPGRDGQPRDFLTRLDPKGDVLELLILSPVTPERPAWCASDRWESKAVAESFLAHKVYRFSLRANPTRKVAVIREDGTKSKNGRRLAIHKEEDLLNWLVRKGEQAGFHVEPQTLRNSPAKPYPFTRAGHRGAHAGVDFSGVLEVTDPVLFAKAFQSGIGSAKAFGFGLLMLSPLA